MAVARKNISILASSSKPPLSCQGASSGRDAWKPTLAVSIELEFSHSSVNSNPGEMLTFCARFSPAESKLPQPQNEAPHTEHFPPNVCLSGPMPNYQIRKLHRLKLPVSATVNTQMAKAQTLLQCYF